MPTSPRARFGLYVSALVVLVTSAIIALVAIGSRSASAPAADAQHGRLATAAPTSRHHHRATPDGHRSSAPPPAKPASAPPSRAAKPPPTQLAGANHSARAARPPKIYTVRPGDNLTVIAAWFHVHGYQPLYAWNKTVIGRNPDLIFPGQQIVVVPGGSVSVRSSH